MAEKVTIMVLKVDLQCPHCRKKIKKVLCKFSQISDRTYDEKHNTVTIKVVCCSPEKIRDKLCCKGGKTIKSIDILPPPKPKPPQPAPPEKPKVPEKAKEPEKPKAPQKPKDPERPKDPGKPKKPNKLKEPVKLKEPENPEPIVILANPPEKPAEKPKEVPKPDPPKKPDPPPNAPPPPMPEPVCVYPIGICCGPCYEGRVGGPCYHGYGVPPPPPPPPPGPCYDSYGYYGGYGRGYCGSRGDCFSDENPSACTIM